MKFSIIVILLIILVSTFVVIGDYLLSPTFCIDGEDAPKWLGSETGCGPELLFKIQKSLGLLD